MDKLRQAAWTAIHKINRSTGFDEASDVLLMEAASVLREALGHSGEANEMVAEQADREALKNLVRDMRIDMELKQKVYAALAEQESFDMDDHPPHRLCECRKCMEYFTPLPDCDAFAASGKPIAEQEPVVKYPGCDYCNDELFCGRKCKCCGKVFIEDEDFVQSEVKSLRQQVAALKAVLDAWNNVEQEPVAWLSEGGDVSRSKKFFDDMGFKSSPLYAAPVQQAEQEPIRLQCTTCGTVYANGVPPQVKQAEQEPVGWWDGEETAFFEHELNGLRAPAEFHIPLYAAPVRTKDLTDTEKLYILGSHIDPITKDVMGLSLIDAAIAADRRKNK